MSIKSEPKSGITNMTAAALDVEELERRLELATSAADCDCCGGKIEACGVKVEVVDSVQC